MQGLLALFSLLGGLFKIFTDWRQRSEIARATENQNLVEVFSRALRLLRISDEARSSRARLDADVEQLREDDGQRRGE